MIKVRQIFGENEVNFLRFTDSVDFRSYSLTNSRYDYKNTNSVEI